MTETASLNARKQELEQALAFLDGMFAHTGDGLVAFDHELRIVRFNTAAERLTQVSAGVALGASLLTLFPRLSGHAEHDLLVHTLEGTKGKVATSAWSGREAYYVPLRRDVCGDDRVLGGYVLVKGESDAAASLERLTRANADLERFAYVAAHDLQEPARMVASYTQLISDKIAASVDETTRRYLDFALDGAQRMRGLIDGLLAVAKLQAVDTDKFAEVSLDEVASDALALLSLALDESAAQVTRASLPRVHGERVLLVQLFQNVLANALKFRREEPLRIDVRCVEQGPREWRIEVEDNGIGVPERDRERVFHLLQRAHSRRRYPGSGIGLSLCKEVVTLHGGRIWMTSEVGRGTCVSFTLKG